MGHGGSRPGAGRKPNVPKELKGEIVPEQAIKCDPLNFEQMSIYAQRYVERCLAVYIKGLGHKSWAIRLACADRLMDRAYGKVIQPTAKLPEAQAPIEDRMAALKAKLVEHDKTPEPPHAQPEPALIPPPASPSGNGHSVN